MSDWQELEAHVVHVTKGTLTPASGRLSRKGDVWAADLLIECKQRTYDSANAQVSVTGDWLATTKTHAWDAEKVPIVAFGPTYQDVEDTPPPFYFCLRADLSRFQEETQLRNLTRVPDGWALITEKSLGVYTARHRAAQVNTAWVPPRPGGPMKGQGGPLRKSFGGGSTLSGKRSAFSGGGGGFRKKGSS